MIVDVSQLPHNYRAEMCALSVIRKESDDRVSGFMWHKHLKQMRHFYPGSILSDNKLKPKFQRKVHACVVAYKESGYTRDT